MKDFAGSVSIFFIFAIVLIISVVLSVTELARYNCQKLYLQIASDAGLDSMLSLYHRKLYEYYSLYGVEYKNDELLTEEYLSYVKPHFVEFETGRKIANWYNASLDAENVNLQYKKLIDDTYFEKEILEYMKYKAIGKTIEMFGKMISIDSENDMEKLTDSAKDVFNKISKTDIYGKLHEKYFNFRKNIKDLESCIKEVNENIEHISNHIREISEISTNSSSANIRNTKRKFEVIVGDLSSIEEGLISIRAQMEDFKEAINESRMLYISDKESGIYEFNDDVCGFIESEFDEFASHVSEGSEIDIAIDEKNVEINIVKEEIEYIDSFIDLFVDELESIDEEITRARNDREAEYDSDYFKDLNDQKKDVEKDFKDYLREIKVDLREINISNLSIGVSSGSHQSEEDALVKLSEIGKNTILKLVLDDDIYESLSNESLHYNDYTMLSDNQTISINKLLLTEYELDKFNYYNKVKNGEVTKSNSENYEVERLISGKNSNKDSLEYSVSEIFKIRLALNLLYIYKNPEMRTLAREFAYTVFGGFSVLLAEIMFLLIITAWGSAQSIIDVKRLMKNVNVSFIHNESTWDVAIDKILDIALNGVTDVDEIDDSGLAFSYKDYMRMLLIMTRQSIINERMISIIEQNVRSNENTFDIEKIISNFEVNNTFMCKHYFTNFILKSANDVVLNDEYKIKTSGYRSFIE